MSLTISMSNAIYTRTIPFEVNISTPKIIQSAIAKLYLEPAPPSEFLLVAGESFRVQLGVPTNDFGYPVELELDQKKASFI